MSVLKTPKASSLSGWIQVVGSGAKDAVPSIVFSHPSAKFLFNAGESLQRVGRELGTRAALVDQVYLTRISPDTSMGLPGLLLSNVDTHLQSMTLFGPAPLRNFISNVKNFCFGIRKCSYKFVEGSEPLVHLFEDNHVRIDAAVLARSWISLPHQSKRQKTQSSQKSPSPVKISTAAFAGKSFDELDSMLGDLLNSGKAKETNSPSSGDSKQEIHEFQPSLVCYMVQVASEPGNLNVAKLNEVGVTPSKALADLKAGKSVTVMARGVPVTLHPHQYLTNGSPGLLFTIVDCPSLEFIDPLVSHPTFQKYQNSTSSSQSHCFDKFPPLSHIDLMFHLAPPSVLADRRYQKWVQAFGQHTQHVLLDPTISGWPSVTLASDGMLRALNLALPSLFPFVDHEISSSTFSTGSCSSSADIPATTKAGTSCEPSPISETLSSWIDQVHSESTESIVQNYLKEPDEHTSTAPKSKREKPSPNSLPTTTRETIDPRLAVVNNFPLLQTPGLVALKNDSNNISTNNSTWSSVSVGAAQPLLTFVTTPSRLKGFSLSDTKEFYMRALGSRVVDKRLPWQRVSKTLGISHQTTNILLQQYEQQKNQQHPQRQQQNVSPRHQSNIQLFSVILKLQQLIMEKKFSEASAFLQQNAFLLLQIHHRRNKYFEERIERMTANRVFDYAKKVGMSRSQAETVRKRKLGVDESEEDSADVDSLQGQTANPLAARIRSADVSRTNFAKNPNILQILSQLPSEQQPELVFLGTGSACPSALRNVSSILLRIPKIQAASTSSLSSSQTPHAGLTIMIDAGEGTTFQMSRLVAPSFPEQLSSADIPSEFTPSHLDSLGVICITHDHGDHHFGLLSVLNSWQKAKQQRQSLKAKICSNPDLAQKYAPFVSYLDSCADQLLIVCSGGIWEWLVQYSKLHFYGQAQTLDVYNSNSQKLSSQIPVQCDLLADVCCLLSSRLSDLKHDFHQVLQYQQQQQQQSIDQRNNQANSSFSSSTLTQQAAIDCGIDPSLFLFVSPLQSSPLLQARSSISGQTYQQQHQRIISQVMKRFQEVGLQLLHPISVDHIYDACGYAFVHSLGWKVVFSGDTMPSQNLINYGYGATVMVHEATLEEDMLKEAADKRHSTTKQAIQSGVYMNADRIILTHFSQRYPRLPHLQLDASTSRNNNTQPQPQVGVAFDLMRIRLGDHLSLVPQLNPLFQAITVS